VTAGEIERPGRARRLRPGPAALAFAACATALAACGGGGSAAAVVAPSCMPTALDHSARLPGTRVDVSPEPGSVTANPHTQVSFLGAPAGAIGDVSVVGARSGRHAGALRAYSQGDGASFVPAKPFDPGERVVVRALIGTGDQRRRVAFAFRVDTPYSTAGVGNFPYPTAPPDEYQTFATMPGLQAPILTVTTPDRDPAAGDILTTNGPGPGRGGPLIYTSQGQLVWFDQLRRGLSAEDLTVQRYAGHRDLTFWEGNLIKLGFGLGEDVVMSSRYRVVATVRGGNGLAADLHDFRIAPHDVAYISAYNPIRCNLATAGGSRDGVLIDTAVEAIDIRTGLVRWEWNALDHVSVRQSRYLPPAGRPWDWFHLNSIDYEPDGDIFISARNTWAGYQIAAGRGRILWTLGGAGSSFRMGPGTQTAWQHDGRILPDGNVTFFDDGSNPPVHSQSRAVRIALDFKHHRARLVSAFTHEAPPLLATSQGNVQTLANGDAVVGFGGVPEISEYSPSGAVLFDAHLPYDMLFYRVYRFRWSGQPSTRPAVSASLNDVAETIVHMSWNGATDVRSWRVLAGPDRDAVKPRATVPAVGFETSTMLTDSFETSSPRKAFGYVAVQALDAAGQVLATSRTVAVTSYAAAYPVPHRRG